MSKSPILFLIFNRLDTTKQVFLAIKKIKPQKLYIASDGPRDNVPGENNTVQIVRDYLLSNIDWPCEVKTMFREKNLGCKIAVSSAIDWFFQNEEYGIILEDDCLPDTSFFQFCDELLEKYKNDMNISVISGNNFNVKKIGVSDYYFSKIPHIWGWATWRRAWNKYDITMSKYPGFKKENAITSIWTDKKVQSYWLDILDEVHNNKINTWDYQLTFSTFLDNCFCICPNVNLVSNIGFGKDFTNTLLKDDRITNLPIEKINFPIKHPLQIEYKEENDKYINNFYLKYHKTKKLLKRLGIFSFIKKAYITIQSVIK